MSDHLPIDSPRAQATYTALTGVLAAWAKERDHHVATDPDCPAHPLCAGADVIEDIRSIAILNKRTAVLLLLTAVGEISRLRHEVSAADDSVLWMREQQERLQSRVNELTAADWDAALREVD